jgi:hypothetical protein
VEYKDALSDPVWLPLQIVLGDGTTKTVVDINTGRPRRFYRLSMQLSSQPIRPTIESPVVSSGQIQFTFLTVPGKNYVVEHKNALTDALWTSLQTVPGDGTRKTVTNSVTVSPKRLFRLRVE